MLLVELASDERSGKPLDAFRIAIFNAGVSCKENIARSYVDERLKDYRGTFRSILNITPI